MAFSLGGDLAVRPSENSLLLSSSTHPSFSQQISTKLCLRHMKILVNFLEQFFLSSLVDIFAFSSAIWAIPNFFIIHRIVVLETLKRLGMIKALPSPR